MRFLQINPIFPPRVFPLDLSKGGRSPNLTLQLILAQSFIFGEKKAKLLWLHHKRSNDIDPCDADALKPSFNAVGFQP